MAVIATPFMFSHMFMAVLNPNTRIALSGMTTGLVDRHYVQSHHARWYREEFEESGEAVPEDTNVHTTQEVGALKY